MTIPAVVETDGPASVDEVRDGISPEGTTAALAEPVLTKMESRELVALERLIDHAKSACQGAAHALATIRDDRLYRVQFPDFESYCRRRWGFSRQRAPSVDTSKAAIDRHLKTGHHARGA